MAALIIKQGLKSDEMTSVKSIIEERETRKATYNYLLASDDTTRYKAKAAINEEYRSRLTGTLFQLGKIVGSYNCRMIMRNKDTLGLSTAQQDQIAEWAVKVDKMLAEDSKVELRPIEFPIFKKLFTPVQLELFLNLKLHDETLTQAAKTWATLKENGLEYGMDSLQTAKELYNYHLARGKANYVNYNNAKERDASLKAISEAAPMAIRRTNSIPEAIKAKNAYNGTLTW